MSVTPEEDRVVKDGIDEYVVVFILVIRKKMFKTSESCFQNIFSFTQFPHDQDKSKRIFVHHPPEGTILPQSVEIHLPSLFIINGESESYRQNL
jgi:hypothetical protein